MLANTFLLILGLLLCPLSLPAEDDFISNLPQEMSDEGPTQSSTAAALIEQLLKSDDRVASAHLLVEMAQERVDQKRYLSEKEAQSLIDVAENSKDPREQQKAIWILSQLTRNIAILSPADTNGEFQVFSEGESREVLHTVFLHLMNTAKEVGYSLTTRLQAGEAMVQLSPLIGRTLSLMPEKIFVLRKELKLLQSNLRGQMLEQEGQKLEATVMLSNLLLGADFSESNEHTLDDVLLNLSTTPDLDEDSPIRKKLDWAIMQLLNNIGCFIIHAYLTAETVIHDAPLQGTIRPVALVAAVSIPLLRFLFTYLNLSTTSSTTLPHSLQMYNFDQEMVRFKIALSEAKARLNTLGLSVFLRYEIKEFFLVLQTVVTWALRPLKLPLTVVKNIFAPEPTLSYEEKNLAKLREKMHKIAFNESLLSGPRPVLAQDFLTTLPEYKVYDISEMLGYDKVKASVLKEMGKSGAQKMRIQARMPRR